MRSASAAASSIISTTSLRSRRRSHSTSASTPSTNRRTPISESTASARPYDTTSNDAAPGTHRASAQADAKYRDARHGGSRDRRGAAHRLRRVGRNRYTPSPPSRKRSSKGGGDPYTDRGV